MSILYVGWPGLRESLVRELAFLDCIWIPCEGGMLSESLLPVSFARQILPDARLLTGASIKEIAEEILPLVPEEGEWSLQSYSAIERDGVLRGGERRCGLVKETVLALLKKKRRSALRGLCARAPSIIQHCLLSEELSCLSSYHGSSLGEQLLSPIEGARTEILEDKTPPSRAYRKLTEALLTLGREIRPGQSVVDLGAAPGSWSYVALKAGARVTAIDRAALSTEIMLSPRLSFVEGDAFSFQPETPVDWLICDVISAPERIVSLTGRWLKGRLCKNFCVTMKFKGEPDFVAVRELRQILAENSDSFFLRHLENNKNEITACGTVSSANPE